MKYIAFVFVILVSCQSRKEDDILPFLASNNKDSLVKGIDMIPSKNSEKYVKYLLKDSYDPSISHSAAHYGKSVFYIKMEALSRISGLVPPTQITNTPDSIIVKFYGDWALRERILN